MIYTSYYGNWRKLLGLKLVGVSKDLPPGVISMDHLPELGPSASLLARYKENQIGEEEYTTEFLAHLQTLSVHKYGTQLKGKVLLCYEKGGFCHRHLVAAWLKDAGYEVREF
jgi:hypothetical protein